MNELLNLQLQFSKSLLMQDNDIDGLLNEHGTSTLDSPVAIYNNAYQIRLVEALAEDYPMLNQLLGAESFKELAREYIDKYPSSSFSLRGFGRKLATFLAQETLYQKQAYLSELAAIEWQLVDVFDLADSPVASISDMSRFAPEDWPLLRFKLHGSVRWLTMHWNITEIYQALRTDTDIPDLRRLQSPQVCLVWRKQYSPHYRTLDSRECLLLKTIEKNNFAELCNTLAELDQSEDNAALDAATYLKSWLSAELIEAVNIEQ